MQIEKNTFYTCKYDRPFKEIFLNEQNKHLLKGLLETILKTEIDKIELKPSELNSNNINIKRKYLDALIYVKGKKIGIEVNSNAEENYLRPRNASFIFNIYSSHTIVGETYNEDTDIIQINLSYNLKDKEKMRVYKLRDKEGKEYIKNLYIYEINMDYYRELWYNEKKEITNEKYLVMLDLGLEELKKFSKKEKVVGEYMDKLEKLNKDPEFYQYMSHEEDERKIYNSRMYEAEQKGLQKGLNKGLKEGIEKGMEKGMEKGSKNKSIEIATNLKNFGTDIETISKATGLSKEEIEKL